MFFNILTNNEIRYDIYISFENRWITNNEIYNMIINNKRFNSELKEKFTEEELNFLTKNNWYNFINFNNNKINKIIIIYDLKIYMLF